MSKRRLIHLTARALEFLKASKDPVNYRKPTGQRACNHRNLADGELVVHVADVRAMVRGDETARERRYSPHVADWYYYGVLLDRPVVQPTCLRCLMLLEQALINTKQQTRSALQEERNARRQRTATRASALPEHQTRMQGGVLVLRAEGATGA